jgi:hypothetical protein
MTGIPGRIDDPVNLATREAALFDPSQVELIRALRIAHFLPVLVSFDLRQRAFPGFA